MSVMAYEPNINVYWCSIFYVVSEVHSWSSTLQVHTQMLLSLQWYKIS